MTADLRMGMGHFLPIRTEVSFESPMEYTREPSMAEKKRIIR